MPTSLGQEPSGVLLTVADTDLDEGAVPTADTSEYLRDDSILTGLAIDPGMMA